MVKSSDLYINTMNEQPRKTMADVFGEDIHGVKTPMGMPPVDPKQHLDETIKYLEGKTQQAHREYMFWKDRLDGAKLMKESA